MAATTPTVLFAALFVLQAMASAPSGECPAQARSARVTDVMLIQTRTLRNREDAEKWEVSPPFLHRTQSEFEADYLVDDDDDMASPRDSGKGESSTEESSAEDSSKGESSEDSGKGESSTEESSAEDSGKGESDGEESGRGEHITSESGADKSFNTDIENDGNTTSTLTGAAQSSVDTATTSSSACVTRADPRAVAFGYETSEPGTPCVFGVDLRDEGWHCIMEDGKYGSFGWCFTSTDLASWGSCEEACPLFGPAKVLASKIDSLEAYTNEIAKTTGVAVKEVAALANATANVTTHATAALANATAVLANATAALVPTEAPSEESSEEPIEEQTEEPTEETNEEPTEEPKEKSTEEARGPGATQKHHSHHRGPTATQKALQTANARAEALAELLRHRGS